MPNAWRAGRALLGLQESQVDECASFRCCDVVLISGILCSLGVEGKPTMALTLRRRGVLGTMKVLVSVLVLTQCLLVSAFTHPFARRPFETRLFKNGWTSDFDDFVGDDDDSYEFSKLFAQSVASSDRSACKTRQFSLGPDLVLDDFVGNLGFDEVTDWEYVSFEGERKFPTDKSTEISPYSFVP